MPKRKVHIWFGSRNRITGSELTVVSPNSEFNVQLEFPQDMPKYSKYTVQVKQFSLQNSVNNGPAPGIPNYTDQDGFVVSTAFFRIRGLPYEDNYQMQTGEDHHHHVGPLPNPIRGILETPILTRIGLDSGNLGEGTACVEPKTDQPKVVVGRLNGFCVVTCSLRNGMGGYGRDLILTTPIAVGQPNRQLGPWCCLLEVEGIDGYEEFICPPTASQPIMTNGINNQNHVGFQNNNKKIPRVNTSFI